VLVRRFSRACRPRQRGAPFTAGGGRAIFVSGACLPSTQPGGPGGVLANRRRDRNLRPDLTPAAAIVVGLTLLDTEETLRRARVCPLLAARGPAARPLDEAV
jgi:hypothetical protein